MIVEHFMGKKECSNFIELEKVLRMRTAKGVNEFIINSEEEFPYLIMSVKDEYACLNYFDEDNSPGYSSIGGDVDLNEDEISIFYTNTDEEEIEVANYSIMSFQKAIMAVKEFFETNIMPKCIEWEEL